MFVCLYVCLYVRTNGNQIENENLFGKKYVQRKLNSLPTTSRADALRSLAPYPKFDQFRNNLLIETRAALFCDQIAKRSKKWNFYMFWSQGLERVQRDKGSGGQKLGRLNSYPKPQNIRKAIYYFRSKHIENPFTFLGGVFLFRGGFLAHYTPPV